MKKLPILFLILISCSKNEFSPSEYVGKEFSLENGEMVVVNPTEGGLSSDRFIVEVVEISDIRCPEDVACIWGGNAKVKLKIEEINISLCIGTCATTENAKAGFSYKGISYTITLNDVLPFPKSTHPPGIEKSAVLMIDRI